MKTVPKKKQRKAMRLFRLKNVLLFVALLLALSLSLHMVIPHHHAKDLFGEGLQAALHGEDKKWRAALVALSLLLAGAFFVKKHSDALPRIFQHNRRIPPPPREFFFFFDPLRQALRRGIMHPKICG